MHACVWLRHPHWFFAAMLHDGPATGPFTAELQVKRHASRHSALEELQAAMLRQGSVSVCDLPDMGVTTELLAASHPYWNLRPVIMKVHESWPLDFVHCILPIVKGLLA